MRKPRGRNVRKAILAAWLTTGLLISGYGFLLSGCAPVLPAQKSIVDVGQIHSLEMAERAWQTARVAEYGPIWIAENKLDGDRFTAGLVATQLASVTGDTAWSNVAIKIFNDVLEQAPDLTHARAWRGLAHALLARDFPVQGLWQIVPGPGFVRLHHVRASFRDLDKAIAAAPHDPVIRLIRASTYLGLPSIFGGRKEGLADFNLLHDWVTAPEGNPEYVDLLQSKIWQEEYYLARATMMTRIGKATEVAGLWEHLGAVTDNPLLRELAKWHLTSIGTSQ
ncbi:hypothetical protein [Candidatus Spongiihabitans sp.]|uniref:hypothetical protein n=1 Tax=Candidatus Spongiihabitans sp. TaxID=3101308 RepID=UPI003C6F3B95